MTEIMQEKVGKKEERRRRELEQSPFIQRVKALEIADSTVWGKEFTATELYKLLLEYPSDSPIYGKEFFKNATGMARHILSLPVDLLTSLGIEIEDRYNSLLGRYQLLYKFSAEEDEEAAFK